MNRLLPLLLLLLVACEQPTAADLVRTTDRIERELYQDIQNPASAWHGFGFDGWLGRLPVMGTVRSELDRRSRRYRGLVFERVVLRRAAGGEYCPSVTRTIAAADGERGILLHTADGPSTFGEWEICVPPDSSHGAARAMLHHGAARLFVVDGYHQTRYARSGTAEIALESLHGPCDWVAPQFYNGPDEPIDAWCEVGTYTVRAQASLGHKEGPANPPAAVFACMTRSCRDFA